MSTWWQHRTKSGRVVYDRKPNPFRGRDVVRIFRSLLDFDNYVDAESALHQEVLDLLDWWNTGSGSAFGGQGIHSLAQLAGVIVAWTVANKEVLARAALQELVDYLSTQLPLLEEILEQLGGTVDPVATVQDYLKEGT